MYDRRTLTPPNPTPENNNNNALLAAGLAVVVAAGGAVALASGGAFKSKEVGVNGLSVPAEVSVSLGRTANNHLSFDNGVGNQAQVDFTGPEDKLNNIECGTATVYDAKGSKLTLRTIPSDNAPDSYSCIYEGVVPTSAILLQIDKSLEKEQNQELEYVDEQSVEPDSLPLEQSAEEAEPLPLEEPEAEPEPLPLEEPATATRVY